MKRVVIGILLLMAGSVLAEQLKIADAPVELAISQITDRTVRVDFLSLDDQGKPKPAPPSSILEPFASTEKLRIRELNTPKDVQIGNLKVTLKPQPLTIMVRTPGGRLVQELTVKDDGSIVFHTDGPTFGLGEGRQQFDRRGFYYNFVNGQNDFLATHGGTIPVPFLIGMDPAGGWGLFFHNPPPANAPRPNTAWAQFDLRGEDAGPPPPRPSPQNAASLLKPPAMLPTRGRFIPRRDTLNQAPTSIFIMNLDRPADALGEYIHLVGSPVMPPKWVMGYMQSHRSLAGPQEVIEVAQTLRDHQLPCDAVIYLGSGYTNDRQGLSGWNLGHGSLEFNPRIFDKPQEMIDKLRSLNFKIVLHKNAAPARLHGSSVNEQSTDPLHISNYWATHVNLMKMGIDAWWPDDGDELPIENRMARIKTYYEGPLKDRPNERPWSLDRNGYAGVAKYGGWNWSGDVTSRWDTLAAHVPVGVQFSLSVSPWWGTDIGGFVASSDYTGELYTRWFQFATFCPLFRSHGRNWKLHTPFGWNTGEIGPIESRPTPPASELHNAEVEPVCKKYLDLRYSLLPYNYTLTREACDTGMPPMRALLLAYPDDAQAVALGDEYLWGPDILIAPVVEKGATLRRVYLPAGDWYDWWTGKKLAGKQWIERPVDLATMPIYTRAGAIIPIDPVRQYTAQPVTEPTTLQVHPGADGAFTLYDDDGHTEAYKAGTDGSTQWIGIEWNEVGRKLTLRPDPRMKKWPGGVRNFSVKIAGSDAPGKRVEFRGEQVQLKL